MEFGKTQERQHVVERDKATISFSRVSSGEDFLSANPLPVSRKMILDLRPAVLACRLQPGGSGRSRNILSSRDGARLPLVASGRVRRCRRRDSVTIAGVDE